MRLSTNPDGLVLLLLLTLDVNVTAGRMQVGLSL
jgi:hypothetical protein